MVHYLVGDLSWPDAAFLCMLFASIAASILFLRITARKPMEELTLERQRLEQDHQETLYKLETARGLETKKLEQNLITSHKVED